MLRTIHLYGQLEELAGTKTFDLDVDTPVMLVSALNSQVAGFRTWSREHKLAFVLTDSDTQPSSLNVEDFRLPLGKATDIHLVPETEGAGAAAIAAIATYFEISALAATLVFIAANIAVSFAIGAIAQALAPSPDTGAGSGKADERPSFLYNGAVNVVEQGYAVPIVYGTHMTGSVVISAGVSIEDIPYVPATPTPSGQPSNPPAESYQWVEYP